MNLNYLYSNLDTIMKDFFKEWLSGLEAWCEEFNNFAIIFFGYMKFIFVFILLSIGILTLLRFRGIYTQTRTSSEENKEKRTNQLDKSRLITGIFYIVFAFGILTNWLTYFLILILDPLPDRLIFNFINFAGKIDPNYMNRIEDLNSAAYPHEKTIYYCMAIASFGAILDLVISVWYIINSTHQNLRTTFELLIGGVTTGILAGFTTCLPFFL